MSGEVDRTTARIAISCHNSIAKKHNPTSTIIDSPSSNSRIRGIIGDRTIWYGQRTVRVADPTAIIAADCGVN